VSEFVNIGKVKEALNALKQYANEQQKSKPHLFENASPLLVNLTVVLKKVPVSIRRNDIEVVLPYPFQSMENTSICVFCKDIDKDKWGPDVDISARFYKEYLHMEKGVREGIDEIIALRQLKREYKTFEAKRKLCSAYDVFLVDDRIVPHIHRNLGKSFHQYKKLPFPVSFQHPDLLKQIRCILGTTRMVVKQTSVRCSCLIGLLTQPSDQLVANFVTVLEALHHKLPGGDANIHTLYLHCAGSAPMLPIYASVESSNCVTLPAPKRRLGGPIEGELTTLDDEIDRVKVYADGRVNVMKDGKEMVAKLKGKRKRGRRLPTKKTANSKRSRLLAASTTVA